MRGGGFWGVDVPSPFSSKVEAGDLNTAHVNPVLCSSDVTPGSIVDVQL